MIPAQIKSLNIELYSTFACNFRTTRGVLALKCYLRGIEPQLIKLEFIIYLPKLKVTCPLLHYASDALCCMLNALDLKLHLPC